MDGAASTTGVVNSTIEVGSVLVTADELSIAASVDVDVAGSVSVDGTVD